MARFARIIVRHRPHHITAHGNRREPIFFENGDHEVYRDLLAEQADKAGVEIWAYCFMPNHVHRIAVPRTDDGLARTIGEAHRRYTNYINTRARFRGHLFQNRFGSVVMDEAHLVTGARYVSLNPVRARLAARAQDWPWSSVRAHLAGEDDGLVTVKPSLDRVRDFRTLLQPDARDEARFATVWRPRAARWRRKTSYAIWSDASVVPSPGVRQAASQNPASIQSCCDPSQAL
jgi:putative transposase